MNALEFVDTAVRLGYCTKGIAKLYVAENKRDEYSREELPEAYRLQKKSVIERSSEWISMGNGNYKKKKHNSES